MTAQPEENEEVATAPRVPPSISPSLEEASPGLFGLRSEPSNPLSPLQRVRRLAALERSEVGVLVVYAITIGLLSLAVPIAAQALVNTVAFTARTQPILVLAMMVLVGLVLAGVLKTLQQRVVEVLQQRFFVRAAHESVRRLVRADIDAFGSHSPSELLNRFFDVAAVQKASSTLLLEGLGVILQGSVSLLLLAFYHPALLAFDAVLISAIAFIIFGLGRGGVSSALKESEAKYNMVAFLQEMASAHRSLKSSHTHKYAFDRSDELAKKYVLCRRSHFRVLLRQIVGSYALQAIATAALLGLGGALIIGGELTLGQLVAAELIVTGVLASVSRLGKYLENYYDLLASLHKIGAVIDLPEERSEGTLLEQKQGPAPLILENVSFSYDGKNQVLAELSLEIPAGGRVAILGADCSGKNTLSELIYGLRLPSKGRIRLDGVDLRSMTLSDLRRDVAFIGKPELFEGTAIENIQLGRPEVNASVVSEALEAVGLTEELDALPLGASTQIGPGGRYLTASQAARLSIARELALRPRLLLIKQSMDALGIESVKKILDGIERTHKSTTLLVLSSNQAVVEAVGDYFILQEGSLSKARITP